MRNLRKFQNLRLFLLWTGILIVISGCTGQSDSSSGNTAPRFSATATEQSPEGDVPDNAVFVTYTSQDSSYTIQYVEGWKVEPQPDGGVSISDIDSAEQLSLIAAPADDILTYAGNDASQLQSQVDKYQKGDLKTIQVNGKSIVALTYTWTSAPDVISEKRRAVISQRYYIPGSGQKLAVLTLTTPVDVDNVDAFRQMLESFTWTAS